MQSTKTSGVKKNILPTGSDNPAALPSQASIPIVGNFLAGISPDFRRLFAKVHNKPQSPVKLLVQPGSNFQSANQSQTRRTIIFVNGACSSVKNLPTTAGNVANMYGQQVSSIINAPAAGLFGNPMAKRYHGLLNGVLGIFSHRLGTELEPRVIVNLSCEIISEVARGKEVLLVGHSHGSVVILNTLLLMKAALPKKVWNKCCQKLQIEFFGAASHRVPSGIDGFEYAHSNDPAIIASGLIRRFVGLNAADTKILPCCRIISDHHNPHSLESYLEDRAKFFMLRYATNLNNLQLAEKLYQSINSGSFSDFVHRQIIEELHNQKKPLVIKHLRSFAKKGRIGSFTL